MIKLSHIIVGIITFCLITFWVEPAFVGWIVNSLPASVDGWKHFLKVILWVVVFCCGFGLTIWISIIVGGILGTIINK